VPIKDAKETVDRHAAELQAARAQRVAVGVRSVDVAAVGLLEEFNLEIVENAVPILQSKQKETTERREWERFLLASTACEFWEFKKGNTK
jgi:hypothetical protein